MVGSGYPHGGASRFGLITCPLTVFWQKSEPHWSFAGLTATSLAPQNSGGSAAKFASMENSPADCLSDAKNPDDCPSESEVAQHKSAAYQQALYQAWFSTALEQTRSVFTISSAGVGLSLTLLFQAGKPQPEKWVAVWLVLAVVLFSVASWLCVLVFKQNTRIVSKLITAADSAGSEGLAGRLQLGAQISFSLAVVFLVFSAVCHTWL